MAKAELIRPIVPIEEWLTSEFYLGDEVEAIRPYVAEFVKEFNHATYVNELGLTVPKRKFIATGASRTGKSYGSRILLDRVFYEMSCWRNFPCLFGLSPSTMPKVFWLSYTMSKSTSTGMKGLMKIIDKTPYWQLPDVKRKDVESAIIFPFCEVLPGSNVSHIIGEDMLGCVLDEANVRKVAQGTEVEETQKMFQEMRQRSVMTFSKNGVWGGFSGIISSTTTSSSFVALELEKAKKDGDTVIMEASVYEANPEQYSKEKFPIFIGNGEIEPFIVDQADETIRNRINETYGVTLDEFIEDNPQLIEPVPVSIRKFYEEDLVFSLANMSGKAMSGSNKYMSPKIVNKIWDKTLKNPFNKDIPQIGIYDSIAPYEIWNPDIGMENYHGENVYVHIDASQKHDHTGFSALYYDVEDKMIRSILTVRMFMNKEIPDNQIDQEKILQLLLFMRDNGVNFKFISGDHYSKDWLIPQCKKIFGNDHSEYLSVDKDPVPYLTMLNLAKLDRYGLPYYKPLEHELVNLNRDLATNKVDHNHNPDGNNPIWFKDCSDGLAGATHNLYIREHIQYEQMMIEKELEKVEIPDDGFFSTISTDEEGDIEDEMKLFTDSLYGEDESYTPLDDIL